MIVYLNDRTGFVHFDSDCAHASPDVEPVEAESVRGHIACGHCWPRHERDGSIASVAERLAERERGY